MAGVTALCSLVRFASCVPPMTWVRTPFQGLERAHTAVATGWGCLMWARAPILILDLRNDPRHRLTVVAADERDQVIRFLACRVHCVRRLSAP